MELGMLDTTREARFESMRRQWRSAQLLRRHEDLRKQCEKEVRAYDNAQRLLVAECRRAQVPYEERLRTLCQLRPGRNQKDASSAANSVAPRPSREAKLTATRSDHPAPNSSPTTDRDSSRRHAAGYRLLFCVRTRNGRLLYVRDETKG